jgi:hypothetical protein
MAELKAGVFYDVPYDTYAAWDAINHSRLRHLRNGTPLHMQYAMTHESPPTKALDFGWAAHIAVLEPKDFESQVYVVPKIDRRTKEGKLLWLKAERESQGRLMVSEPDMVHLRGMRASVLAHPTARELVLGKGKSEVSLVWNDAETGVLCKARSDRLAVLRGRVDLRVPDPTSETTIDCDLKTITEPASQRTFEREAHRFGYFEQAAMRLDALETLAPRGEARPFVWIVVEKEPPYAVRLFQPDEQGLEWGRQQYRKHLAAYAECMKTGVWPGWDDGIDTCSVPPWVEKVFEE